MNTPISNHIPIALWTSSAALLTLLSSSLFYNRIEAPLAILILITAISQRTEIFAYFIRIKFLLILQCIYAFSLLTNGMQIGTREFTSLADGFSNFGNVLTVSVLGALFATAIYVNRVTANFRILLLVFAAFLFLYCLLHGGRVYDLTGRYVLTVGFLLTLLSLCYLVRLDPADRFGWVVAMFINSFTLYVVFVGIESRAMTMSLLAAWFVTFFTLDQKFWQKLIYTIVPVLFCVLTIAISDQKANDIGRYNALYSLIKVIGIEINAAKEIDADAEISDSSVSTRYLMLKVGVEKSSPTWPMGQGNLAEAEIVKTHIGENFSTIHNLYLSFLIEGGILHLLIGFAFVIAPFCINPSGSKIEFKKDRLHLIIFSASFMMFESFVQLTGFQNLYIMYSYLIFALLTEPLISSKKNDSVVKL